MSKIKSLELRKLLKELEFIELDFEYRSEMISEADAQFINSINIFLKDHPELKEIYDNKVTEKINQSIKKTEENVDENHEIEDAILESNDTEDQKEEPIDIEENEEEIKNKEHLTQIKKLYREIVKLTHPDKIKDLRLNEIYLKATKYYDSGNKIGIYAICNELQIPYEISDDDITLIYDQITNYKNKISFIESTYTWKWYNCEDEAQKNQILLNYIKMKIK